MGGNYRLFLSIFREGTSGWKKGSGPLGFDLRDPNPLGQNLGTKIKNFLTGGNGLTAYFTKSFLLASNDLNLTYYIGNILVPKLHDQFFFLHFFLLFSCCSFFCLLGFTVRRVDGIVVYLNGVEIWRDNMKWGRINFKNTSIRAVSGSEELTFSECGNCRRNNSALLKVLAKMSEFVLNSKAMFYFHFVSVFTGWFKPNFSGIAFL